MEYSRKIKARFTKRHLNKLVTEMMNNSDLVLSDKVSSVEVPDMITGIDIMNVDDVFFIRALYKIKPDGKVLKTASIEVFSEMVKLPNREVVEFSGESVDRWIKEFVLLRNCYFSMK